MIQETTYHGWKALALNTGKLELIVPTEIGPRVMSVRLAGGGKNLLWNDESSLGGKGEADFQLRGGHRLWHAPEDAVRTYQPDNRPLQVERLGERGVRLTQEVEALTGLEKSLTIETLGESAVQLTHRLTNRGNAAVECAVWPLTMFRLGGTAVIPLLPKGQHPRDLLPTYHMVPWSYTDLSLPVWNIQSSFIGVDTVHAAVPQKLGLSNYLGWSAYCIDGIAFVKQAKPQPGKLYPDFGCSFETYCDHRFIELETLSPLGSLQPGQSVEHVERWGLLEDIARPTDEAAYLKSLYPAATRWVEQLG
jgi:hypothetical protein